MENRQLIQKITINNFTEYIKKADRVRPVPYIKGKSTSRLPKMYSDEDKFEWRTIHYWGKKIEARFDKQESDDSNFLIANSKTANKPRLVKVNGQSIYNQSGNAFGRAFMRDKVHDFFGQYLKDIEPFDNLDAFPLSIWMKFYLHDMGNRNIDNDNKWPWEKFFQDSLVEAGLLKDDSNQYINDNRKTTFFIPDAEEQKLVVEIYGRTIN